MSKSSKNKKDKVPKITEEEYMAYLSSLKDSSTPKENTISISSTERVAIEK